MAALLLLLPFAALGQDSLSHARKKPIIFTPNNDGVDDHFAIHNLPTGARVSVVNRWGITMAEWKENDGYWDGMSGTGKKAAPAPSGSYYYSITKADGTIETGVVELVR